MDQQVKTPVTTLNPGSHTVEERTASPKSSSDFHLSHGMDRHKTSGQINKRNLKTKYVSCTFFQGRHEGAASATVKLTTPVTKIN